MHPVFLLPLPTPAPSCDTEQHGLGYPPSPNFTFFVTPRESSVYPTHSSTLGTAQSTHSGYSVHAWQMMGPQAYLVPEDQSHYATDKLHYEADPQDIHKLQDKMQRDSSGDQKEGSRDSSATLRSDHSKVVALPDWVLLCCLPLLEIPGLCWRRLDSRVPEQPQAHTRHVCLRSSHEHRLYSKCKSGLPPSHTARGGRPRQHFQSHPPPQQLRSSFLVKYRRGS